jgi:hypothetical protein
MGTRAVAPLALALAGCTHLSHIDGAIPLQQGQSEWTLEGGLAREPGLLGTPTQDAILPTIGVHHRVGLGKDLDFGVEAYTLGLGADLRYRFLERGGWHFAIQPSLSGIVFPLEALTYVAADVALPVRVERPLGKYFSVAGGPGLIARQTYAAASAEGLQTSSHTFSLFAGGGVRGEFHYKRIRLGSSAQLYVDATRATGLYGGVGVDFGILRRARASAHAEVPVIGPSAPWTAAR